MVSRPEGQRGHPGARRGKKPRQEPSVQALDSAHMITATTGRRCLSKTRQISGFRDNAGVQRRNPIATCQSISRAAQSEVGVVGERDRMVFVLDAEEQRDRAEELLSKGWVVRLDVGQDRRSHI